MNIQSNLVWKVNIAEVKKVQCECQPSWDFQVHLLIPNRLDFVSTLYLMKCWLKTLVSFFNKRTSWNKFKENIQKFRHQTLVTLRLENMYIMYFSIIHVHLPNVIRIPRTFSKNNLLNMFFFLSSFGILKVSEVYHRILFTRGIRTFQVPLMEVLEKAVKRHRKHTLTPEA